MREIKFRAWDKLLNEMIYNAPRMVIRFNGSVTDGSVKCGDFITLMQYTGLKDKNFITLMQYTGLKDKNGVEIYEGDICKWRSIHNKRSTDFHTDTVEFASGYWNLSPWVHELYSCHDDIEVIGNIYEHPELIE